MHDTHLMPLLWTGLLILIHLAFVARAILRPHREPASRVAWVVVMVVMPVAGIVAYLFLGETSIGRRRAARLRSVLGKLPPPIVKSGPEQSPLHPRIPDHYEPLFRAGHSVNGFEPVGGNRARLLPDSNATIDAMVATSTRQKTMFISPSTFGCRTTTDSRSLKR